MGGPVRGLLVIYDMYMVIERQVTFESFGQLLKASGVPYSIVRYNHTLTHTH